MKIRVVPVIALLPLLCLAASTADACEGKTFGKPLAGADEVAIADLVAHPEDYVGKTVQVKGQVTDVCTHRGCWIDIAAEDESSTIRFKVKDGVIEFPTSLKGKRVVAEGVFTKIELTEEQALAVAKHHAEERGEEFDPASVQGPVVIYRIAGQGAVVH